MYLMDVFVQLLQHSHIRYIAFNFMYMNTLQVGDSMSDISVYQSLLFVINL